MLSHLLRRKHLIFHCLFKTNKASITVSQSIVNKKKILYQNKAKEHPNPSQQQLKDQQIRQHRETLFQQMLFQLGKELHLYFNHKEGTTHDQIFTESILLQQRKLFIHHFQEFTALQLINYIQVIKSLCLTRLQYLENIHSVYLELQHLVNAASHRIIIEKHMKALWKEETTFQIKIRSVCLLQYVSKDIQQHYFREIVPFIKYFKTADILILIYEKWKFSYTFNYQLLDQIHNNRQYNNMEEVNECYIKMLFIKSVEGYFTSNHDCAFFQLLLHFHSKKSIILHSTLDKYLKILQNQGALVQTEQTRYAIETNLNLLVEVARNQKYKSNQISIDQLVQIYLNFEETKSTGQILLNEITFLAQTQDFRLTNKNFEMFKSFLLSVLSNIQRKVKYQRLDYLNKSFSMDTIHFLNYFIPMYIEMWPEVIYELNDAFYQLFPQDKQNRLLSTFQLTFKKNLNKTSKINLINVGYTLKVLRFVLLYQRRGSFSIKQQILSAVLKQLSTKDGLNKPQLQVFYLILKIIDQKGFSEIFNDYSKIQSTRQSIQHINRENIEKQMQRLINQEQQQTLITSYSEKVVWLALCNHLTQKLGFPINFNVVEIFINKKLIFMINSLQFEHVYEIFVYCVSLSRISTQVYSQLLYNLSTFIIYINSHHKSDDSKNSFFLNQRYSALFLPICEKVIQNKAIFSKIKDKQAFKILQILFYENIQHFSNQQILKFLQIIGHPKVLNPSFLGYLQQIQFSQSELYNLQDWSNLQVFEYYNPCLLRLFEGKYNEVEIKEKLKNKALRSFQIREIFSQILVYKTIITNGDVQLRFEIPIPETSIPEFKYMYVCQKIFEKISRKIDFNIQKQLLLWDTKYSFYEEFRQVNLTQEIDYIQQNIISINDYQNQFRITSSNIHHYFKFEIWNNYLFFDKTFEIPSHDLFFYSKELADQILYKLIKGITGKIQKIRQIIREFTCQQAIIATLNQSDIPFKQHGASLEFRRGDQVDIDPDVNGDKQKALTLICTNNRNYKILYICAYMLSRNGEKVGLLKQNESIEEVIPFLRRYIGGLEREQGQQQEEGSIIE